MSWITAVTHFNNGIHESMSTCGHQLIPRNIKAKLIKWMSFTMIRHIFILDTSKQTWIIPNNRGHKIHLTSSKRNDMARSSQYICRHGAYDFLSFRPIILVCTSIP